MRNKERTGLKVRIITMMFAVLLTVISVLPVTAQTVSAASNTTLITKYLKSYKAGNYSKANKYLNKMKKTDRDTSLKKMSTAQKKAYRKVVKKYSKNINDPNRYAENYLWGFLLSETRMRVNKKDHHGKR